MSEIDKDVFIQRTQSTIDFAKRKCIPIFFKEWLEKSYSNGLFYSVPIELFDPEEDKDFIESLYYKFMFKQSGIIAIPDGVYQLLPDNLKEMFLLEIHRKISMGCYFDLSYVPKVLLDADPELLKQLEGKIPKEEELSRDRKIYLGRPAQVNKNFHLIRKENPDMDNEELKNLYALLTGNGDGQFLKVLLEYNDSINQDVENMIKYRLHTYDVKSILNLGTEDNEEAVETFEGLKEILVAILKNLSKTGTLEDLIKNENTVIGEFNNLLSDKNKVAQLTQESVFENVQSLDMSKKEDVINMLVQLRHYANKLAHNYDNYMWTTVVLNCYNQASLESAKDVTQDALEKLIEKRKAYLKEQFLKRNIGDISEEEFIAIIKKFGKDKKFTTNNLGVKNKKAEANLDMIASLGVEKPRILSYDSTEDYCIDVFEEFELMIKDYYRVRNQEKRNDLFEKNFMDFFTDSYYNENFEKMYGHLLVTKGKKELKMTDIIREFIPKIRYEGMIRDDYNTFSNIIRKFEMRDLVFSLKHFCTMALLTELKREQSEIRMENQSPSKKIIKKKNKEVQKSEPGVVDIYVDGYIQVFGGHYKDEDPEQKDEAIQRLDCVHEDVTNSFKASNDKDSLRTFVPIARLTSIQKDECKNVVRIFDAIATSKEPDETMEKKLYEKINQMYHENPDLFNSLYIRFSLGAGLEQFKNKFQVSRINIGENPDVITEEEKCVADALLKTIKGKASIEDFLNSDLIKLNVNIRDYCKEERKRCATISVEAAFREGNEILRQTQEKNDEKGIYSE